MVTALVDVVRHSVKTAFGPLKNLSRERQLRSILSSVSALMTEHLKLERTVSIPKNLICEIQPWDLVFWHHSPLYRRSRTLYVKMRGSFRKSLISMPRSYRDTALFNGQVIDYSPSWDELYWAFSRKGRTELGPKLSMHLTTLRNFSVNIFHEQNHRNLSKALPDCPLDRNSYRRFTNFSEALTMMMDYAFADELGKLSVEGWMAAGIFLNGISHLGLKTRKMSAGLYRNYLLMLAHFHFLLLEGYSLSIIEKVLFDAFPRSGIWPNSKLRKKIMSAHKFCDPKLLSVQNFAWQNQSFSTYARTRKNRAQLEIPQDPYDLNQLLSWGGDWLSLMGI